MEIDKKGRIKASIMKFTLALSVPFHLTVENQIVLRI